MRFLAWEGDVEEKDRESVANGVRTPRKAMVSGLLRIVMKNGAALRGT